MFGIALSAAACLRSGTRVDVAWIVDRPRDDRYDPAEAVAITPGGGRLGSLLSGALDGQLDEQAAVHAGKGRRFLLDVSPADAAISGVEAQIGVNCMLVPGSELPSELWEHLLDREAVCLVSELDGDSVVQTLLYTSDTISDAGDLPQRLFQRGLSAAETADGVVVTALWPTASVVIVGGGPIAESLKRVVATLGWQSVVAGNALEASGLIAGLAPIDSVVVAGHDLELTGRALMAALSSKAGYVGAVGPKRLQDNWADWLSYRGLTDLSQLNGPAGLDIGARNPEEVALAIAAEIVAKQTNAAGQQV